MKRLLLIMLVLTFCACIPTLEDRECFGTDECPGGICIDGSCVPLIDAGIEDAGTSTVTDGG